LGRAHAAPRSSAKLSRVAGSRLQSAYVWKNCMVRRGAAGHGATGRETIGAPSSHFRLGGQASVNTRHVFWYSLQAQAARSSGARPGRSAPAARSPRSSWSRASNTCAGEAALVRPPLYFLGY
jgi:hypothetical protein